MRNDETAGPAGGASLVTKPDLPGGARARSHGRYIDRGTLLGRYVVLDVLGAGAMGVVYSAYDPELDRKVAVKLLQARAATGLAGDDQAWLQREAQAMARVTHPNVISVYDVGMLPGDRVFIAMELVHGQTLRDWLEQRVTRAWREVLPLLRAAGEGLAAAHAAGLVHRDFKPANVLVDGDGRARVVDFGLARLSTSDGARHASDASFEVKGALSADLTSTGQVVGTPAYMAPELFEGHPADAASDQFSFGAALYEALYGTRPFTGAGPREPKPPPAETRVPVAVHRVVMRALSTDPSARYPSMTALLADLSMVPHAGRRRWGTAVVTLLLAGVAAAMLVIELRASASQCGGADERLQAVWTPSRQSMMTRAFAESKRPDATAVLGRIVPIIDRWTETWRHAYVGACEDTRVRRVQSDQLLDRRMACLTRRLDEARAAVELLAAGGGDAVDHALDLARDLPAIDSCANVAALSEAVAPPPTTAAARDVARVRAQIDDARARRGLGRFAAAAEVAKAALARAAAVGYAPVIAEAQLEVGMLQHDLADRGAADTLAKAMTGALAVGDFQTAISAAASRIVAPSHGPAQFATADEVSRVADAIAQHAALGPETAVELDRSAAVLLLDEGKLDQAKARLERAFALATSTLGREAPATLRTLRAMALLATERKDTKEAVRIFEELLAIRERIAGPDHPDVATAIDDLANAYSEDGRSAEVKTMYEHALAIRRAALGPDHPVVANALNNMGGYYEIAGDHLTAMRYFDQAIAILRNSDDVAGLTDAQMNLATTLSAMGDHSAARSLLDEARAMREKIYGRDDPRVASVLVRLGETMTAQQHYDEALAELARAEQILTAAYGSADRRVLNCLGTMGVTYMKADRLSEARDTTVRVVAAIAEVYGPDHPQHGVALGNLGLLQLKLEDARGALASLERALAIFEAKLGPNHPNVAMVLSGTGSALLALDRPAEAATRFERAVAIASAAHVAPEVLAEMQFGLAKALIADPPTRGRAIAEAKLAVAGYEHAHDDADAAQVRRWLRAR